MVKTISTAASKAAASKQAATATTSNMLMMRPLSSTTKQRASTTFVLTYAGLSISLALSLCCVTTMWPSIQQVVAMQATALAATAPSTATSSNSNNINAQQQQQQQQQQLSTTSTVATCGYPGSPAHASVTFSSAQIIGGTVATYTCDNGYELLGPPKRVCQTNGTWSPIGIPFCVLNVGLGKAAMQSSTAGMGSAQKAVDGLTSQFFAGNTCTMTDAEANPWWYVNLLEPYLVQIVRIDFGVACCGGGKQKATIAVRVGNNRPDIGVNALCNRYTGFIEEGKPLFLPCTRPAPGAFVSIHLESPSGHPLSICETFIFTDHALSIEQCPSFRDQPLGSTATYNGKCYLFHNNQNLNFDNARRYCENRGGTLVDETSPALQGFLSWELYRRHRADQLSGQYWLGAVRDPRNSQNWKWISGKDVQISFWNSQATQSNCSRFDGSKGWLWSDTDCNLNLNFICQYRPLSCGKPEKPTNSTLITRNVDIGTVIEYNCAPGNMLQGPKMRTCLANGFFSEFAPKCKYLDCAYPAMIPNGDYRLINGTTSYQSIVTYGCNEGYLLYGRSTLSCDVDERWNGPPPRCEPQLCPAPSPPNNGFVTVSSNMTLPGTLATFDCRQGYELVGERLLTCIVTGSWDNSFPYCKEKRLPTATSTTSSTTTTASPAISILIAASNSLPQPPASTTTTTTTPQRAPSHSSVLFPVVTGGGHNDHGHQFAAATAAAAAAPSTDQQQTPATSTSATNQAHSTQQASSTMLLMANANTQSNQQQQHHHSSSANNDHVVVNANRSPNTRVSQAASSPHNQQQHNSMIQSASNNNNNNNIASINGLAPTIVQQQQQEEQQRKAAQSTSVSSYALPSPLPPVSMSPVPGNSNNNNNILGAAIHTTASSAAATTTTTTSAATTNTPHLSLAGTSTAQPMGGQSTSQLSNVGLSSTVVNPLSSSPQSIGNQFSSGGATINGHPTNNIVTISTGDSALQRNRQPITIATTPSTTGSQLSSTISSSVNNNNNNNNRVSSTLHQQQQQQQTAAPPGIVKSQYNSVNSHHPIGQQQQQHHSHNNNNNNADASNINVSSGLSANSHPHSHLHHHPASSSSSSSSAGVMHDVHSSLPGPQQTINNRFNMNQARFSLDGIIAVAIFGGFIFLGAIITIIVIIIKRRKSNRSSIDAQTISTFDSSGEHNGLYRNYQQAWENLRFGSSGNNLGGPGGKLNGTLGGVPGTMTTGSGGGSGHHFTSPSTLLHHHHHLNHHHHHSGTESLLHHQHSSNSFNGSPGSASSQTSGSDHHLHHHHGANIIGGGVGLGGGKYSYTSGGANLGAGPYGGNHHGINEGFRDSNELTLNADVAALYSRSNDDRNGQVMSSANKRIYSTNSIGRSVGLMNNHHNQSSASTPSSTTQSSRASPPSDHSLDHVPYTSQWSPTGLNQNSSSPRSRANRYN